MNEQPAPEEGRDASLDRRVEEEAMRYPEHEDPAEERERVGLDDRDGERPEPEGAPRPEHADDGPTPSADSQQ